MKSVKFWILSSLLLFFSIGETLAANINVPADYPTISAAITAASSGDTISIANGTYNENLVIDKPLVLFGSSQAGVIINIPNTNVQGIIVNPGINNVTIQNLTIDRPIPLDTNPLVCTNCFGVKLAGNTNVNVNSITIKNSVKSGLIVDGSSNILLSNITSNNSITGNGVSVTDSNNVALSNITTIGNGGSDIGFYTKVGSLSNVVLSGTNDFGSTPIVTYSKRNSADSFNIDVSNDFSHEVYGTWIANAALLPLFPGETANNSVRGIYTKNLNDALSGAPFLERVLGDAVGGGDDISPLAIPALLAGLLAAPDPNAYLDLNLPSSDRIISPVILRALDNSLTVPDEDQLAALGYQAATPKFSSLAVTAQDSAGNPKAIVGSTYYVGIGERIHFNLGLNPADTVGSGNSFIGFDIGTTSVQTANLVSSTTPTTNRTRTYNINNGENGIVDITGVTLFDAVGLPIENLPSPFLATNIVVDTTAPTITSVTQVSSNPALAWAKTGDTVTYSITYSEPVTVSTVNTASTANNATGAVTEVSASNSNTDTLIVTVQAGDNGWITPVVDLDITDLAGNTTNITTLAPITGGNAANKIKADTIVPTLDTVTIASDNTNTDWAKLADTIKIQIDASERLKTTNVSTTIATQAGAITKTCAQANCETYDLTRIVDGATPEGLATFAIDFTDRAGNVGTQVITTTNASTLTVDKTIPTVTPVTIASNNPIDPTSAKTGHTITVTFTIADNLSANAFPSGAASILSNVANTAGITLVGPNQTIARATDGSETTEVIAPFSFKVKDSAGNVSTNITATTDGSQVKFDRTDPVLRSVRIKSVSADGSAYMGDAVAPNKTYYAKTGDKIVLKVQICDYVDSNLNPPTGTIFGNAVTFTDRGLVGAPGNCTTGAGNTSQWRKWRAIIDPIPAAETEGLVPFAIDPKDNAGNMLIPSTTMTTNNNSRVIFDKTAPALPDDMVDLGGPATPGYKPQSAAATYTWTNDADPLGVNPVSAVHKFDIRYNNPNTGINESVTINAPTRSFSPVAMIPDVDPYTVNMQIWDKAGNSTGESVVYTQRYGITINGKVTEEGTGNPIGNTSVNIVAKAGETCGIGEEICVTSTDNNGDYSIVVAPNKDYIVDLLKTIEYYLAKEEITVGTNDVTINAALKVADDMDSQTGQQTITIITDKVVNEASSGSTNFPTEIYVDSFSGQINARESGGKIIITSFGRITQVLSNNPNVVITFVGNNTYEVTEAGSIREVLDKNTRSNTVSTSFQSGNTRSGTQRLIGGDSTNSFNGIRREDRLNIGVGMSYRESLAHAQKMNEGADYKIAQYVNRNGYVVFGGYRSGTLGLNRFKRFSARDHVMFRGRKTSRQMQEFVDGQSMKPQQMFVKNLFKKGYNENLMVINDGENSIFAKMAEGRVTTIKDKKVKEMPGYGKKTSDIQTEITRRQYKKYHFNPYMRNPQPNTTRKPSRIKPKSTQNMILRVGKGRKVVLSNVMDRAERSTKTLIVKNTAQVEETQ